MALEVKIVQFNLNDRKEREAAEKELADLLNDRWSITLHGGSDGFVYILLQKGDPEKRRPLSML